MMDGEERACNISDMRALTLSLFFIGALGCGKKEAVPKPQEQSKAPPKPVTVLWEFETGDSVLSDPAIGSDGMVYVGSRDNKLYAINGNTGGKLWEFETGGPVHSSPAIGPDGTVYVGSQDSKLYAINPKSGGKLWEFKTVSLVFSSPAIGSDGTVYVGSIDNKLYAINGKTGVKLWNTRSPTMIGVPAPGPGSSVCHTTFSVCENFTGRFLPVVAPL